MRALASAKVKHARIHDMRHSFASAAAVAGVSIYTIQKMLGYASSQTSNAMCTLQIAGPCARRRWLP